MIVTINLPKPPSVNKSTINVDRANRGASNRSRVKSPDYRSWIETAGWELILQRPKRLNGPVELEYLVEDAGRGDLGNLEKPATDLLVTHRIIEGDHRSIVRRITLAWSAEVKGVRVTIKPVGGA